MKKIIYLSLLILTTCIYSQKPCEFTSNVKDSIGTYKSTTDYLVYESNFADKSNYIFLVLESTNGSPTLNFNFIRKSKEFVNAKCFDKNSKLFFQLNNGKIITLLALDKESCGNLIRDDKGYDNRVLIGTFMFIKGTFEELKSSGVNMMRVRYISETEDYIIKKEILSELNGNQYQPESFFMNYLHCIE
ncbi:hypothetical protein [Flavobacterium sp.]|uniref:hypothetical protein n=1 Tax=Flavobacterium sp. TaxID=239 RepID=UPI0038FD0C2F